MILIAYLLLIIASALQGINDAILYSGRSTNAFTWNEHIVFVSNRILWVLMIASGFFLQPADWPFLAMSFPFAYSFWHNGFYYVSKQAIFYPGVRNYLHHFTTDRSPTDTSRNNFDFASRLYMFLFSLLLVAIPIIKNLYD